MSTQPGTKFTYDDYVNLPDDGRRHESIDGEHFVLPSVTVAHQAIVGNFVGTIWSFLQDHLIGKVAAAPLDVLFDSENFVQPDVLFVSNERAGVITTANVHGAPSLVIEVLSDSTKKRDRNEKRRLYEKFGVEEYWIADPTRAVVEVYRREGDRFAPPLEVSGRLTTPLLPGLEIDLPRVFRG